MGKCHIKVKHCHITFEYGVQNVTLKWCNVTSLLRKCHIKVKHCHITFEYGVKNVTPKWCNVTSLLEKCHIKVKHCHITLTFLGIFGTRRVYLGGSGEDSLWPEAFCDTKCVSGEAGIQCFKWLMASGGEVGNKRIRKCWRFNVLSCMETILVS